MTDEEKKEKMNELMNKISFALKDATLQQGFEIICKKISELEKENEELKKEIEKLKEKHKEAFLKEIANHNKEIAELQKLFNEEHQRFNKYFEETLFLRGENEQLKTVQSFEDWLSPEIHAEIMNGYSSAEDKMKLAKKIYERTK